MAAMMLSAVGHLANLGTFAEIGQNHAYQRETMRWTRRGYRLDKQCMRIELLNAIKEDIRDHYATYAGRIDTMLLVYTLLFTFALAMLQFSDCFVPQEVTCDDGCEEKLHPWLSYIWVWLVAAMLILPFWCIVISVWCKLQLDRWLEQTLRTVNAELRSTLRDHAFRSSVAPAQRGCEAQHDDRLDEAAQPAGVISDAQLEHLAQFVGDYQERYHQLWGRECGLLLHLATRLLWVSAYVAVTLTALMFWLFLVNRDASTNQNASSHFAALVLVGLSMPMAVAIYLHCLRGKQIDSDLLQDGAPGQAAASSPAGEEPTSSSPFPARLVRRLPSGWLGGPAADLDAGLLAEPAARAVSTPALDATRPGDSPH